MPTYTKPTRYRCPKCKRSFVANHDTKDKDRICPNGGCGHEFTLGERGRAITRRDAAALFKEDR